MNAPLLSHARISEIIGRLDYFQGVARETQRRLAVGASHVQARRDEVVFRKGTPAESLHIVVSGQIKVFLPQANGGEKVVALVERNQSFGVASVWLDEPHLADAVANKDSHLLILERTILLREARQDCVLAGRLMDAVCRRSMDLMRNLESCAPRSARQRVVCYLAQRRPSDMHAETGYEIQLPAIKREIATKLNLTQETFSRVLRQLTEEGVIEVRGRLIRVLLSGQLQPLRGEHPGSASQ